jgi:hypothetical protein
MRSDIMDVTRAGRRVKSGSGKAEYACFIPEPLPPHNPPIQYDDEIELCGLCTDICVVSNALILKAKFPEIIITVDASCCAGITEESHKAALLTMKMCQVNVINNKS